MYSLLRKAAWLLLLCALPALAQDVASFEKRTTVRKLNNGLTVVVVERPGAPVFSYFTHVDAGSVQEPLGKSGLAHMFEHMAFKGTDTIGTKNWPAEKAALARVEKAYLAYETERRKHSGRAIEQFVATAFVAHPYHLWGIGWPSEIESWSATDAMDFYRKYYVPSNMVITVVGDVKAAQAMPILEKYFGRMPASSDPLELPLIEPPQIAEKTVVLRDQSQPLYVEGYHRPSVTHPDNAIYDVISDIMSK